jgi:hypothetical protein
MGRLALKPENFWLPGVTVNTAGTESLAIGEKAALRFWLTVADDPKLPLPARRHHPRATGHGRHNHLNVFGRSTEEEDGTVPLGLQDSQRLKFDK